jgi:predicted regulator of Ras-like GTPase activity (Roadblock/LC7/MglB family)
MEPALKEINAVLGVIGSFVCRADGAVAARAMPDAYDDARLQLAARVASQTLEALETSGQRVAEADFNFFKGRLLIRNLRGGTLFILCARTINLPLLNLTVNVAVKKIAADFKPAKPPAPEPPPAPAIIAPAPAPIAPAPKPAPIDLLLNPLASELEEELARISASANEFRVTVRAFNFPAMWSACPRYRGLLTLPEKKQLDLAAFAKQSDAVPLLFERLGYQSNPRFNALYNNRRMNFVDTKRALSADIFFDVYEMYHRLDLTPFLESDGQVLPATALLLTRLQCVETTDALLRDVCALILEHDFSVGAEKMKIDAAHITRVCADDWGWYKTVTQSLERAGTFAYANLPASERAVIDERIQRLRQSIESAPKSLRWQTRARLGETIRWYETPQTIRPTVDQRARPDMALG